MVGQFPDGQFSHRTLERALAVGLAGALQKSSAELLEVEVSGAGAAIHELVEWCRQQADRAQMTSLTMTWLSN